MNYYNEIDPKAAAWLRALIVAGEIPNGIVDERSITEVRATDLVRYTQCHFFAGIGGWSLALKLAGWPEDRPVWTGSCPCQPFSTAGKGLGTADHRHLWPEMLRLIRECRPPVVLGEQVASAAGREWLANVRSDLEGVGYAVGAADLCAAGLGAPHIRQRLFWVANPASAWRRGRQSLEKRGSQEPRRPSTDLRADAWPDGFGGGSALSVSDVLSPSHGLPGRVGLLRGYGNAIVPQVAAEFIQAYLDTISEM